MQSKAMVKSVQGDQCTIMVMRAEACGSCHACSGCKAKPQEYRVLNTLHVQAGEAVVVEMEDKLFFRNVGLLYLMPLLFFIVGLLAGLFGTRWAGNENDVFGLIGGMLGIGLYWLVIRLIDRKKSGERVMHLVRRASINELFLPCGDSRSQGVQAG